MGAEGEQNVSGSSSVPALPAAYSGYAVYIFAYDIAYDMKRIPVTHLLGRRVEQYTTGSTRRGAREFLFYRPQMVRFPAREYDSPLGVIEAEQTIKIYPVGALSVAIRVPLRAKSLEDFKDYFDLRLGGLEVGEHARRLATTACEELKPWLIRPVEPLPNEELYLAFCIETLRTAAGPADDAEAWLAEHSRSVAAVLTRQQVPAAISTQRAREPLNHYLSYLCRDLVVVDSEAALVIDEPEAFEEALHALELANVQLVELTAYDRMLDEALERSYRELAGPVRHARETAKRLREFRIDMARLSDELSNTTKFFGDWHLARVYRAISARLHLADWHRAIDEKIKTLDEMYALFKQDQTNRLMMVLEATIVALFIIDLIVIVLGIGS